MAEVASIAQSENAQSLLTYVQAKVQAGLLVPLASILRRSYDETPLRVRIRTDGEESTETTSHNGHFWDSGQIVKIARQQSAAQLSCGVGRWAPSIRCSDRATGESIAAVLSTCGDLAKEADDVFPCSVVISEMDQAPANSRAEQLLRCQRPQRLLAQYFCICHKIHASAERTWALSAHTLSGVTNCSLSLQGSSNLSHLKKVLDDYLEANVRVVHEQTLSLEVQQFRQNILKTYTPQAPRKKALVLAAAGVLANGDWRMKREVLHYCQAGCCQNRRDTVNKFRHIFGKLLRSLRPSAINRTNWLEWARPMSLIGLLSGIHCIFPQIYLLAFPDNLLSLSSSTLWGTGKAEAVKFRF